MFEHPLFLTFCLRLGVRTTTSTSTILDAADLMGIFMTVSSATNNIAIAAIISVTIAADTVTADTPTAFVAAGDAFDAAGDAVVAAGDAVAAHPTVAAHAMRVALCKKVRV